MKERKMTWREIVDKVVNEGAILLTDGSGFHIDNHFRLNLGCPRVYLQEFIKRINSLFSSKLKAKL